MYTESVWWCPFCAGALLTESEISTDTGKRDTPSMSPVGTIDCDTDYDVLGPSLCLLNRQGQVLPSAG